METAASRPATAVALAFAELERAAASVDDGLPDEVDLMLDWAVASPRLARTVRRLVPDQLPTALGEVIAGLARIRLASLREDQTLTPDVAKQFVDLALFAASKISQAETRAVPI